MKKIILPLLMLVLTTSIYAQTEEGRWMVSGVLDTDLSLDDDDDASVFLLKPGLGKFVRNGLALGGNLGIQYTEAGDTDETDISIGPFVRWYILGGSNLKLFLQTEVNYIYNKGSDDDADSGFGFFAAPGLSYFITDNVSIDVQMGYNYRSFGEDATSENIRLLAGFQIFL